MGAAASLDAASLLAKQDAMAAAGADRWDEAQWEAAEKDDQGRVKAELLLAIADSYDEMRRLGIATKIEYDLFKALPDYQRCKDLGFPTKAEYFECKRLTAGGGGGGASIADKAAYDAFKASPDFEEMRRLGIKKKPDYDAFKASPDYEEMTRTGFATKADFDECKQLGIATSDKAAYDAFKASGADYADFKASGFKTRADYELWNRPSPNSITTITLPEKIDAAGLRELLEPGGVFDEDTKRSGHADQVGILPADEAVQGLSDRLGDAMDGAGFVPTKAAVQMLRRMRKGKQFQSPPTVPVRILKRKAIRLLTPEFIDECVRKGIPVPPLQLCPESAFVDVDAHSEKVLEDQLLIFAVSYCWLDKDHPDPHGFHLKTVQKAIEVYMKGSEAESKGWYKKSGASYWKREGARLGAGSDRSKGGKERIPGIFLDWTALPQDKPQGLRTKEEEVVFFDGLSNINIWYAHADTVMIILDYLPPDQPAAPAWIDAKTGAYRPAMVRKGHRDSGWTVFEAMIGCFATRPWDLLRIDLAQREALLAGTYGQDWLGLVFGDEDKGMKGKGLMDLARGMPCTPSDFNAVASKCHFTSGSDLEMVVMPKYLENFTDTIGGADVLTFSELQLKDAVVRPFLENVVRGGCCQALRVLNMSYNEDLTIPLEEWAAALSVAAPTLKELFLKGCRKVQGDVAGLSGLTGLTDLQLYNTQVQGDEKALRAAIPGLS